MSFFPPPPPPPRPAPSQAQNYPLQTYLPNSSGCRGRGNGGFRGRASQARGGELRRARGGHPQSVGNFGGYSNHGARDSNPQYAGYNDPSKQPLGANCAATAYPPAQQFFGPQNSQDAYQMPESFPEPARREFHDRSGQAQHNAYSYVPSSAYVGSYASQGQLSANWNAHSATSAGQLALQGPPIRIGYDPERGRIHSEVCQPNNRAQNYSQAASYGNSHRQNGSNRLPEHNHGSQNAIPNSRGRGQKRGFGETFGQGGRNQPPSKVQAPPAVPKFGGPLTLPAKPPTPQTEKKRPKKRKRKQNQLGLTPKAEEYESSEEEEDDEGEETRLAIEATKEGSELQVLQINYRGQTSRLQSSSDIAAWIEKRRERFPTKARVAEAVEKRRQREEAQRSAFQAQKVLRNKQTVEEKEKKRRRADDEGVLRNAKKVRTANKGQETLEDAATKSKRKVEKLRKKLEREEKRIADAEAQALVAENDRDVIPVKDFAVQVVAPNPLTPTSQPPEPAGETQEPVPTASKTTKNLTSNSNFKTSSIESDNDKTSSSSTDSSDGAETPEELTSKRGKPRNELPPRRDKQPTKTCRYFLQTGRCRLGTSCKFRHQLPQRGAKAAKVAATEAGRLEGRGTGRVSLYQRLVEQEKRNEDEAVLKAIIELGDHGVLDQTIDEQPDATLESHS